MKPGCLIVFEGVDGAGKTTQARKLCKQLTAEGWVTEVLREPGGTEAGSMIRHFLLNTPEARTLTPVAELLMFTAARVQLLVEKVVPLLKQNTVVILDRFVGSSFAYQGSAMLQTSASITPEQILDETKAELSLAAAQDMLYDSSLTLPDHPLRQCIDLALSHLRPAGRRTADVTIGLDMTVEQAQSRLGDRGHLDLLEQSIMARKAMIRRLLGVAGELRAISGEHYTELDAYIDEDELAAKVYKIVQPFLPPRS
jgi:thymidylate kinase